MSALQVGGALVAGKLYIERSADLRLRETLEEGRYAVVFAARQTGKSSLRRRVQDQLRAAGRRAFTLDLLAAGRDDPARWYRNLIEALAQSLGAPRPGPFWKEHEDLSPAARVWLYLRQAIEAEPSPFTLFIDEVDAVTQVPGLDSDAFFQGLKVVRDAAATDPVWARFTCCLLGVVTERDLVRDPALAPSNAGFIPIDLADFSRAELGALSPYLEGLGPDPAALIDAIGEAAAGHPYQSLRLVLALVEEGPTEGRSAAERVGAQVDDLFVQHGLLREASLYWPRGFVERLPAQRRDEALELYRRALLGTRPRWRGTVDAHADLRVAGLIRLDPDGRLSPRSRIFAEVLGLDWVNHLLGGRAFDHALAAWEKSGRSDEKLLSVDELRAARVWLAQQPHPTQSIRALVTASARHLEARLAQAVEEERARAKAREFELITEKLGRAEAAHREAEARSDREAVEARHAEMTLRLERAHSHHRIQSQRFAMGFLVVALLTGLFVAWRESKAAMQALAERDELDRQLAALQRTAALVQQDLAADIDQTQRKVAEQDWALRGKQAQLAQAVADEQERARLIAERDALLNARREGEAQLNRLTAEAAAQKDAHAKKISEVASLQDAGTELRAALDACTAREQRTRATVQDLNAEVEAYEDATGALPLVAPPSLGRNADPY